MKLHHLEFRGLGPFLATQAIDFDALGTAGLFLLEGPTGVGKSTVIDAIMFACYGDVAGDNGGKSRLVSDFITPRTPANRPYVQLEFSTAGGRFRVRRQPAWERDNNRGGTSRDNTSVLVERLDATTGQPTFLSNRVGEADAELTRAIGLDRGQFRSTMVLAQGDFARFLQAKTDDRRKILERVFGTEFYGRVTANLKERAAVVQKDLDKAVLATAVALGELAGAVPDGEPDRQAWVDAHTDPASVESAVDEAREQLGDAVAGARRAAAAVADDAARAQQALAEGLALASLLDRRSRLTATLEALEAAAPAVAAERTRLAAHQRAVQVAPSLGAWRRSESAESAARAVLVRAADGLTTGGSAVALPGLVVDAAARVGRVAADCVASGGSVGEGDRDQVREVREAALALLGTLDTAARTERDLPTLRREVHTAQQRATVAAEALRAARVAAEALPQRREDLNTERAEAASVAALLPSAQRDEAAAQTRLAAARQLVALGAAKSAADQAVATRRAAAAATVDAERDARQSYLNAIAGHLAEQLDAGEPCPVCGSPDHPQLATPAPDAPSKADVDAAESRRVAAGAALDQAVAALAQVRADIATQSAVAEGLSVDAAMEAATAAAAAVARARAAVDRDAELTKALDELEHQERAVGDQVARCDRAATDAEVVHRTAVAALDDAVTSVADALAGFASVAERVSAVRDWVAQLRAFDDAVAALEPEVAAAAHAAAALRDALAAHGFVDADQVTAATLLGDQPQRVEATIADHDRDVASCRQQLAEPELQALAPDLTVDVAALRLDAETSERERVAAGDREARCQREFERLEAAATTWRNRCRTEADLRAATAHVIAVSRAASGNTAAKLDLPTYVLVRRFEQVITAANDRLATISDGVYALERSTEVAGRSRVGLDFVIRDARTGRSRATDSLSGGESFYTSLALALGLADVVRAEAGGVEIGTLFVDEGFGSLDPHTLDAVMNVLVDLRDAGRVVGVVSHVEELKTRIHDRITVRRAADDGPSTLKVLAGWTER